VNGALLYLTTRGFANRLRSRASQLRNPRYAVAFVLGAIFLWLVFGRHQPPGPTDSSVTARHRELVMAILVSWAVAWTWLFGSTRVALAFSAAEAEFLFASPVARRSLVNFKLFHAQGRVLWSTLIWALLLAPAALGPALWMHAAGLWVMLSTLQLHRIGASFFRAGVREHGTSGVRRRLPALAIVTTVALAAGAVVWSAVPGLLEAVRGGGDALLPAFDAAAARPVAHALLTPFRLLVRSATVEEPRAWLRAIVPALAVLLAHYVWVIRSDAAFEESAAEAAFRRAARLAARGGAGPVAAGAPPSAPPFRLARVGRPAVAIYWKNVTAVMRAARIRKVAAGFLLGAAALAALSLHQTGAIPSAIGALTATWAVFSIALGPQWVRNDLRTDLQHLELLRSYPLSGAEIVAAEAAAAATVLTLVQLILIGVAYAAFLGDPTVPLSIASRSVALLVAAVVLPAVNYLGLLLLNGGALLFPAWIRLGPTRASGVEGLGQNMLSMVVYALALLVALTPALIAGAAAGWPLRRLIGEWAWLPGGLVGLAVLAGESRLLLRPLGRAFERIDIPTAGIEAA
jgi:hypothetical protein